MIKRMISCLSLILALLCLTGCSIHFHSWKPATCVSPKTCMECGKVKGETLRHQVSKRGKCTVCGEALSTVLNLSESYIAPPTLYGGVVLQLTVVNRDNPFHAVMFPGEYTIYDEEGKVAAQGDWTPFAGADHPMGDYVSFTKDSSYIQLKPGAYSVGFTYYRNYEYDDGNKVFVPAGQCLSGRRDFVVE